MTRSQVPASVRSALLSLSLLLAGCGGVGAPPTPPAPPAANIDVTDFMFRTHGADLGPAWVFDAVSATGQIVRVTYTPTATTETHSVYQRDKNCIRVVAEEVRARPSQRLLQTQSYDPPPCYFPLTVTADAPPFHTEVPQSDWTWTDGVGRARGTWRGWTEVSYANGRLFVEEWFTDSPGLTKPTFHRVFEYTAERMVVLKDVR